MSAPHHYAFYRLESALVKDVEIETILPHLLERGVVPKADERLFKGRGMNGMKILVAYLRNRSFETFLGFVECILLAQGDHPAQVQGATVVDVIVNVLEEFDKRGNTSFSEDVVNIQKRYMKTEESLDTEKKTEECTKMEESLDTEKKTEECTETEESLDAEEKTGEESLDIQKAKEEDSLLEASDSTDTLHEAEELLKMPELPYVEEPYQESFGPDGGLFDHFNKKYGLSLAIPPLAVPEGKTVKLRVGLCCYGPFSISKKYLLASDFVVVVSEENFCKPVRVAMEHCLIMPEYKKCVEVVILKASHEKVTIDKLFTFEPFSNPDILTDKASLFFEVEDFCILCAALKHKGDYRANSSSFSSTSSSFNIDDDNLSSASSSFDTEASTVLLERSWSAGSQQPALSTLLRTNSAPGKEEKRVSSRKRKSESLEDSEAESHRKPSVSVSVKTKREATKRRQELRKQITAGSDEKRHCGIEYAALLFQPTDKSLDATSSWYNFAIFICTNCPSAHKMCEEHAKYILEQENLKIPVVLPIEFESTIQMVTGHCPEWSVEPNTTPSVSMKEVQFYNSSYKELFERIELKTCPPRIIFTASQEQDYSSRRFYCKIKLHGAVKRDTGEEAFFTVTASLPVQHPSHPYSGGHGHCSALPFPASQGYYPPASCLPASQGYYRPLAYYPDPASQGNPPLHPNNMCSPVLLPHPMLGSTPYRAPHPHHPDPHYYHQQAHPYHSGPGAQAQEQAQARSWVASSQENIPPPPPPRQPKLQRRQHWDLPESFSELSGGHVELSQEPYQYNFNPPSLSQENEQPLSLQLDSSHPNLAVAHPGPLAQRRSQQELDVQVQQLNLKSSSLERYTSYNSPQLDGWRRRSNSSGGGGGTTVHQVINVSMNVVQNGGSTQSQGEDKLQELCVYESELNGEEKERAVSDSSTCMYGMTSYLLHWKDTARIGFELTDAEVGQLEYDYRTDKASEIAYQAFRKWKSQRESPKPVTVWEMIQILHKAKEPEAIDYLIKYIKAFKA